MKNWARGESLTRDEALDLICRAEGIPEYEREALAAGKLLLMQQAGWVVQSGERYTRAEKDPDLEPPQEYMETRAWQPEHDIIRQVEVEPGMFVTAVHTVPERETVVSRVPIQS